MPLQRNKIRVIVGLLQKKKKNFTDIFFTLIHVICGYDYGFLTYQSRNMKILTKICTGAYGLIINLGFLIFVLIKVAPLQAFLYILNLINHLAHILILIYFDKDTFCNFLKDLEAIDLLLDINSNSSRMGLKIAFSLVLDLGYKIILVILYCVNCGSEYCLDPIIIQILYLIMLLAYDIPLIVIFFTYNAVQFRLKKITNFIENNSRNIFEYHQVYKALVDTTEKIKISFDVMLFVSIFCKTPTFLIIIYYVLVGIKMQQEEYSSYLYEFLTACQPLLFCVAPAFAADSLSAEANKLKLLLHDRLLDDRGQKHAGDINTFIRYIEARPLKYRICRIIPLDSSLPIIILNICVTYLIVLIQFTNLY